MKIGQSTLMELEELYEQGKKLIENWHDKRKFGIHLWIAAITDLTDKLPADFSLTKEFATLIEKSKPVDGEEYTETHVKDINEILGHAVQYFSIYRDASVNNKRDDDKDQVLDYEKVRDRYEPKYEEIKQRLSQEFTDLMWVKIMQNYAKSPIFAVPFIILGAAVIFAVFGILKIQDYQVDLQQLTDRAIERSKQEITEQVGDIQREISEHGTNQKNAITAQSAVIADDIKITGEKQKIFIATQSAIMKEQIETAVPQSVDNLVKSKNPEIDKMIGRYESDVQKIQEDLDKANEQADFIATRLPTIQAAMKIVNPDQSSFQEAMKLLGVTSWILGSAVAFCLLSMVISIAAFVRAGRQKHTNKV